METVRNVGEPFVSLTMSVVYMLLLSALRPQKQTGFISLILETSKILFFFSETFKKNSGILIPHPRDPQT